MSWRDAPLYVSAFDLSSWVIERAAAWPPTAGCSISARAGNAAIELVSAVALALTFPERRERHLVTADEGIVRLRIALRLAAAIGLLNPAGLRFATGELEGIGRMVGGWRKRESQKERRKEKRSGNRPPAAVDA